MPVSTPAAAVSAIVKPVALATVIVPVSPCKPKFKPPFVVVKLFANWIVWPTVHPAAGFIPPLLLSKDTVVGVVFITAPA